MSMRRPWEEDNGLSASRPGAMTVADEAAAARRNQVPLGIAYMVGSTVMFAGGNTSSNGNLRPIRWARLRSDAPCCVPDCRGDRIAAFLMGCLVDATLP
jgi:hypothetical protein